MRKFRQFFVARLVAGVLVVTPVYLATLLLLKAAKSAAGLLGPIAALVPSWLPGENLVSLLFLLLVCFLIGLAVNSPAGRSAWNRIEKSLFQRLPAYSLVRSLTDRVSGTAEDRPWKPALVEIEDALVPAFIIEEFAGGRFTVFVPSVPTPFAGAVYILTADRVHPVDVPFTQAIKAVSQWGSGSKDLVAAMERQQDSIPVRHSR